MAQSVKLSDGSYIDAEGIYDAASSTIQASLNAKTNRIGQILYGVPSATGTWTPTAEQETYTLCSITLPAGTWLLIGCFMDYGGGGIRLHLSPAIYAIDSAHDSLNPEIIGATQTCFALVNGGQDVSLILIAIKVGASYRYGVDARYWGIKAICIG